MKQHEMKVVLFVVRLVAVVHLRSDHLRDRGGVHLGDRSNDLGDWGNRLDDLVSLQRLTADDGVESVVLIGGVVNDTTVTIGIDQGVLSLDVITMTLLLLALDITGVVIVHRVLELVLGRCFWVFDVLDGLNQSRLDSLDESRLDGLDDGRFVMVLLVLWLVVVRVVVLSAGNSQESNDSQELWGRSHIVRHGNSHFRNGNDRLDQLVASQRLTADDGVESVVLIGGVVNDATVTIGIDQGVLSLDVITVAFFLLALDVSSVVIVHGVRELILGRSFQLYLLHQRWQQCGVGNANDGQSNDELTKRITIFVRFVLPMFPSQRF
uniref:Secreted protein n=1 Tax=Anopheles farauti TaxID=69004 RepID=A0A182QFG7_9DIPT